MRHADWLDSQLTRSIATLLERKLVTLEVVSQDGMRVRASAEGGELPAPHARAAREREERLGQALATMEKIEALKPAKSEPADEAKENAMAITVRLPPRRA